MSFQIAIDGPSATGKSTISKMLAKHYKLVYIDTGAMYRSLALLSKSMNFLVDNEEEIIKLFDCFSIEYRDERVYCNKRDVSDQIRSEEIGMLAAKISKYPKVREMMVTYQRAFVSNLDCIMDGRDIGTVVLRNATIKIYLDASVETRAKRRYHELVDKGMKPNYEDIYLAIEQRDYEDIYREFSPLVMAEDAIYFDCSTMTIDEEFKQLCIIIDKKRKEVLL